MRVFRFLLMLLSAGVLAPRLPAQQTPFLNNFTWNPRLFNPASQGGPGGGQIAVVYRNQFLDLEPSARPSTYLLHADISPYLYRRIGVGVQLMGDKTHLLNRLQASAFFAYHLVDNKRLRFSLGAMAGLLSQKFDFNGVRVSNVLDLQIFNNQVSASRFNGGPGLALEYRMRSGSFIALDAAAAQLFSSAVEIRASDGATQERAVYTLMPQLLANLRYRFQGNGFAIEPNVVFRAVSGEPSLQKGLFDANLNAYFLKNNRLMLGAGLRSDQGGVHFQLGVSPASGVQLIASGEMHAALGASFEIGASYAFGAPTTAPDPMEEAVRKAYQQTTDTRQQLEEQASVIRSRLYAINTAIDAATAVVSLRQKDAAAVQCTGLLNQTSQDIDQLRGAIATLDARRRGVEKTIQESAERGEKVPSGARGDLDAMLAIQKQAQTQLDDLVAFQASLSRKCSGLHPDITEGNCIRAGDADGVRELFSAKLAAAPGIPANLVTLQANIEAGVTSVSYRYPDDQESYTLDQPLRNLGTHLSEQIRALAQQGIRLDRLELVTELQEDRGTLDYAPGQLYNGDFGGTLPTYTLTDNDSGQSEEKALSIGTNTQITLEGLAVLKLTALRKYLLDQGIPAEAIVLTLRYNHSGNTYREETRAVLKLRG